MGLLTRDPDRDALREFRSEPQQRRLARNLVGPRYLRRPDTNRRSLNAENDAPRPGALKAML